MTSRPSQSEIDEANASHAQEVQCPVCGYYCLGKGGVDCIDKPSLIVKQTCHAQEVLEQEWREEFEHRDGILNYRLDAYGDYADDYVLDSWRYFVHAKQSSQAKIAEQAKRIAEKVCESRKPVSREECPMHWAAYAESWGMRERVVTECASAIRARMK